jgi:hypothetical protein
MMSASPATVPPLFFCHAGEQNSGNATNYACRFPAMIKDWREKFNNFHLNFYFVLLAAYATQTRSHSSAGEGRAATWGWLELTYRIFVCCAARRSGTRREGSPPGPSSVMPSWPLSSCPTPALPALRTSAMRRAPQGRSIPGPLSSPPAPYPLHTLHANNPPSSHLLFIPVSLYV